MFEFLVKLFDWIMSLWTSLPDSTKAKIIEAVVESFESLFRHFYKQHQAN